MNQPQPPVLLEFRESVAILTLNRPDSLNSFNTDIHQEMRTILSHVSEKTSVRALVITGAGRSFSAGQDLSDPDVIPSTESPDLGQVLEKNYNPMLRTIRNLPIPVICAVNGVAAGAGASLALVCDIVLAARSASFIQAFCKIGLIPDAGGTWTLPRLAGTARAKGMAMLGDKISAEQAENWGMIWRCIDDEQLMEETMKLAHHLATQPTKGLALIKQAIHASETNTFSKQLDLESNLQRKAGCTKDYQEGITAFMEKRKPTFKGC